MLLLSGLALALPGGEMRAGTPQLITPGHSGHWYDPTRSGEGWVLEVLDRERVSAYWFTYDEDGNQRWLTGLGRIVVDDEGEHMAFDDLYVTRGGTFGPGFDPEQVERERVGHARLDFDDCTSGQTQVSAFGQDLDLPLRRLTRTMGAFCDEPPHGLPWEPLREYAGQSGSWYDPSHSGEGYVLQWLTRDEAVLVWFSYDAEGNQYWMLGTGQHEEGRIVFPMLHATTGGRFGMAFDADAVQSFEWGGLELELGCNQGMAVYDSPLPDFGGGSLSLSRLTRLAGPACPTVPLALSDLYELSVTEVPASLPGSTAAVFAADIADDGTVVAYHAAGTEGTTVYRWRPGDLELETLPGRAEFTMVAITSDASRIMSNRLASLTPGSSGVLNAVPMIWQDNTGWEIINGLELVSSHANASSRNGRYLVGHGSPPERGSRPWVWSPDSGQQVLPLDLPTGSGTGGAYGVSNNGRIVVGVQNDGGDADNPALRRDLATRWVDGGEPELLTDHLGYWLGWAETCSADCRIVGGGYQANADLEHPYLNQPWLWSENAGAIYLGWTPDAVQLLRSVVTALSADGSLALGVYRNVNAQDGFLGVRPFLWTQATGIVSLEEVLADAGVDVSDWDAMDPRAVTASGDRILLSGRRFAGQGEPVARSQVLHLTPRSPWPE